MEAIAGARTKQLGVLYSNLDDVVTELAPLVALQAQNVFRGGQSALKLWPYVVPGFCRKFVCTNDIHAQVTVGRDPMEEHGLTVGVERQARTSHVAAPFLSSRGSDAPLVQGVPKPLQKIQGRTICTGIRLKTRLHTTGCMNGSARGKSKDRMVQPQ